VESIKPVKAGVWRWCSPWDYYMTTESGRRMWTVTEWQCCAGQRQVELINPLWYQLENTKSREWIWENEFSSLRISYL